MVWLEEKGREALLAEIKLETQAAGATIIIAGHKANGTGKRSKEIRKRHDG